VYQPTFSLLSFTRSLGLPSAGVSVIRSWVSGRVSLPPPRCPLHSCSCWQNGLRVYWNPFFFGDLAGKVDWPFSRLTMSSAGFHFPFSSFFSFLFSSLSCPLLALMLVGPVIGGKPNSTYLCLALPGRGIVEICAHHTVVALPRACQFQPGASSLRSVFSRAAHCPVWNLPALAPVRTGKFFLASPPPARRKCRFSGGVPLQRHSVTLTLEGPSETRNLYWVDTPRFLGTALERHAALPGGEKDTIVKLYVKKVFNGRPQKAQRCNRGFGMNRVY